ncbi:MAG: endonuclease/exonuclease/phosphatase family protein [Polyangiales bacterium]
MLRAATLNLWNRCGPYEERMAATRAHLAALAPDVIGLQEVLRARPGIEGPDMAGDLASGGYHVAFGSARNEPIQFGNAILSRWPIVRQEVLPLPAAGDGEPRCLLFAEIDSPFGRIPFFCTHLNWMMHEGHVREEQVRFVVDQVRALAGRGDFPAIVVGDFNAEPESDEMRFMRGLCSLGRKSVYFADCFLLAGEGEAATFSPKTNPFAWHSLEPERRIDYVYVRGPDVMGRGKPLSARRCFDQPIDGTLPSDHYGVIVELSTSMEEIPR